VFTSDEAGNGKTHEINKIIRDFSINEIVMEKRKLAYEADSRKHTNIGQIDKNKFNPNKPLENKAEEKRIQREIENMDPHEKQALFLGSFEKIIISGFVTPDLLKRKMMKIKNSRKDLRFLYIEIDYIENLDKQGYLLNDFLFNVCVLKFFSFGEEPFFLPSDIQILIEVSPYLDNVLYNQIVNLKLFNRRNLTFDLSRFDLNKNCEFALDARIIVKFYLTNLKEGELDRIEFNETRYLIPYKNKGCKMQQHIQSSLEANMTKEQFMETFETLFVNQAKENNFNLSFSLLKLFIKILSHELRNINASFFYDQGEDYKRLKVQLMRVIVKLVAQNIRPSIESQSKQDFANKAGKGNNK
jgi:hypothetical protein